MADEEQRLRDIQREYLDFLDDEVSVHSFIYFIRLLDGSLTANQQSVSLNFPFLNHI